MRIVISEGSALGADGQREVTINLESNDDLRVMGDVINGYIEYTTEHNLAQDSSTTKIVNMIKEAAKF